MQEVNPTAYGNSQYKHFEQFKKLIEKNPGTTIFTLEKYASRKFKQSQYVSKLIKMYITNVNSSLSSMLGWSLCITVATFFLYRSRPWVLSAPGGIRSFAFKYVPFWGAYSQYDGMCVQKVFADKIEADFGQIEEQFWEIYSTHQDARQQLLK